MKTIMAPHTPVVVSSGNGIVKSDRRASKPLMEKRRRERINKSLNELKSILLDALRKDSTCHSKLEKADILEMTVRYLRSIQRQRISTAMAIDPSVLSKYRAGYVECKSEVSKFLENTNDKLYPEVKSRLMSHLGNSVSGVGFPNSGPMVNPHHQLMTTGPTIPGATSLPPLPHHMSQDSHVHAMAAAAAMLSENQRNHGYMVGPHSDMSTKSIYTEVPYFNGISPSTSPIMNSRPASGSSTGPSSPDYHSSPSLSPESRHQYHSYNEQILQHQIRGNFVLIPNSMSQVVPGNTVHTTATSSSPPRSPERASRSPFFCSNSSDSSVTDSITKAHANSKDRSHAVSAKMQTPQPFVNLPVKTEPHSPKSTAHSPVGDQADPVWRPW